LTAHRTCFSCWLMKTPSAAHTDSTISRVGL
jgi:hypothetical protein